MWYHMGLCTPDKVHDTGTCEQSIARELTLELGDCGVVEIALPVE